MSANEQYVEHQLEQLQELFHTSLAQRWTAQGEDRVLQVLIELEFEKLEAHLCRLLNPRKYKEAKDTMKYATAQLAKAETPQEALQVLEEVLSWAAAGQFA